MSKDIQAHIPVLLEETIAGLKFEHSATVVDATLGSGGHAARALETLDENGTFIGIDADEAAIKGAKQTLRDTKATVHLVHENFRNIDEVLKTLEINTIHALYADLGWRIEQYEEGGKGLSFQKDEPLIMTYGDPEDTKRYPCTAAGIVNTWDEEDIANVLYGYGEERYARRIAKHIIAERTRTPIESTETLTQIIKDAVPARYRNGRIHPATKSFQALRIAVNDELAAIEDLITKSISFLKPGGRIAIITFHSIEDRIVKQLFKTYAHDGIGVLVHKKPVVPTREEIQQNPRARSAKLRILEKT